MFIGELYRYMDSIYADCNVNARDGLKIIIVTYDNMYDVHTSAFFIIKILNSITLSMKFYNKYFATYFIHR